jgi:hypothetical protein
MEKKAEYQISSSVHEGILLIVLTGKLIESAVENLVNELTAIVNANSVKNVLVDIRDLVRPFRYIESFIRVRKYSSKIYFIHFAFVDIPQNADYEKFHETAAVNTGLSMKWFTDIDAARAWLKSK